uniref:Peptidase M12B domain-containing protein n=1 Tax=Ditylenchus dipsaci TaxID=166011 RepID=A0A915CZK9_9BILA
MMFNRKCDEPPLSVFSSSSQHPLFELTPTLNGIFLWHVTEQSTSQNQFTGLPLSASELVQLGLNLPHPIEDLLEMLCENHVVSTSTKDSICHFEGVNKRGEHSSLSACSIDVISGLLRYGKKTFILSHTGSSFSLIPHNGDSCDWSHSNYLDEIKRHVELAFIADHSIYLKYNKDEKKIHDRLQSIASVVNSLYSPLNIRITLVYADIWAKADVFEVTSVADKTLSQFVAYRKSLLNEHPHDNAHLITDTRFGEVIARHTRHNVFI